MGSSVPISDTGPSFDHSKSVTKSSQMTNETFNSTTDGVGDENATTTAKTTTTDTISAIQQQQTIVTYEYEIYRTSNNTTNSSRSVANNETDDDTDDEVLLHTTIRLVVRMSDNGTGTDSDTASDTTNTTINEEGSSVVQSCIEITIDTLRCNTCTYCGNDNQYSYDCTNIPKYGRRSGRTCEDRRPLFYPLTRRAVVVDNCTNKNRFLRLLCEFYIHI
jgi:hypothetical protein